MFNFKISGITPRDIENHNKTFNFNVKELFTGNSSGGGGETPVNGKFVTSLDMPSGGCYWDTGIKVNQDTEIRCTFMYTSNYIKPVYGDGSKNAYLITGSGGSSYFGFANASSLGIVMNTKFTTIQNKSGITCNGTFKAYANVADFESKYNLFLGQHGTSGGATFEGSLLDFQIYQAGQLVLDWRAFVDADGKPCFYDTVSKTNKYNLGTGTLTYTE